ncbi:MAG: PQQ-dependent sugar dehydrogenase [Planctomycetota bacterium]
MRSFARVGSTLAAAIVAAAVQAHDGHRRASTTSVQPPGFFEETISGPWSNMVGIVFADDGRMVVWSKDGRVWITAPDGTPPAGPVLDLRQEVGEWRDHGMLGLALDPDFLTNGRIYLLYVVDYHHLDTFGTPSYSANTNQYFRASIGRVSRYTLDVSAGFSAVVADSRTVLIGETRSTGIPILHESHGVGSLAFGTDGTLLISTGDSASYVVADDGGPEGGSYGPQGVERSIITSTEDIGAYRSQSLQSLCGKMLRIDPETGDGIESNPFFAQGSPRAPQSRIWSLGLRNPFRFAIRPETGSHAPADADPGVLFIGDVGWDSYEELTVIQSSGANAGWPLYEGLSPQLDYVDQETPNVDAPNPLPCATSFTYANLLLEATQSPPTTVPNPCDPAEMIPASIPFFVHERPVMDWAHDGSPARVATWNGAGEPTETNVGTPESPVAGASFTGTASVGGVFYTGTDFPAIYQGAYFHADWSGGWIRAMRIDENHRPIEIIAGGFGPGGAATSLAVHPTEGGLWYIRNGSSIRRVRFGGNQAPVAAITADVLSGTSPLTVQFSGVSSNDPDGTSLSYLWDFGDDSETTSNPEPMHTFSAPAGVPTGYTVTLTVTDTGGASAMTTMVVSLNNTPPLVQIISPAFGTTYSIEEPTVLSLQATIADAEHDAGSLQCAWQTILHHNDHTHDEPIDSSCSTSTILSPIGCDGSTYYYRIRLTVTDAAGMSTVHEVEVHPACAGGPACIADCEPVGGNGVVNVDDLVAIIIAFGSTNTTCDIAPDNGDGTFGNGVINIDDVLTVINAFGPCP